MVINYRGVDDPVAFYDEIEVRRDIRCRYCFTTTRSLIFRKQREEKSWTMEEASVITTEVKRMIVGGVQVARDFFSWENP